MAPSHLLWHTQPAGDLSKRGPAEVAKLHGTAVHLRQCTQTLREQGQGEFTRIIFDRAGKVKGIGWNARAPGLRPGEHPATYGQELTANKAMKRFRPVGLAKVGCYLDADLLYRIVRRTEIQIWKTLENNLPHLIFEIQPGLDALRLLPKRGMKLGPP